MKRALLLIFAGSAAVMSASCGDNTGNDATTVITRLAALNTVCVTGYKAAVKPQLSGAATGTAEFQVTFTNPSPEDAQGSLEINMAVEARGLYLGSPPTNVSTTTKPGGYLLPVTTIYPGGVKDGFTTDVILTAPHDDRVRYDIEIYTNIPGQGHDGTPCHSFKATDVKL